MGMWITSTAVLGYSFTHKEVRKALGEEDSDEYMAELLEEHFYWNGDIKFIYTDDEIVLGHTPKLTSFADKGSEYNNEGFEISGWTATQVSEIQSALREKTGLSLEGRAIKLFIHSEYS